LSPSIQNVKIPSKGNFVSLCKESYPPNKLQHLQNDLIGFAHYALEEKRRFLHGVQPIFRDSRSPDCWPKEQKHLKRMTLFPESQIVSELDLHFLTYPKLVFVGLKVVFTSKKELVIGNVNPRCGDPVMETLTLDNDERIVGVKF
jgi:hypothetical protein